MTLFGRFLPSAQLQAQKDGFGGRRRLSPTLISEASGDRPRFSWAAGAAQGSVRLSRGISTRLGDIRLI